jgi:hypothetical protein
VGDLCVHHAGLAEELGRKTVLNGGHAKRRNARARTPVVAETEPLEPASSTSRLPSSVRPALALTAAEEVETICKPEVTGSIPVRSIAARHPTHDL